MWNAYVSFWKNGCNFNDRTSRSGYWLVVVFHLLLGLFLFFLLILFFPFIDYYTENYDTMLAGFLTAILCIFCIGYSLATIIPSISIMVRRLHDVNIAGGWWFVYLIPYIGWIIMFVFLCLSSDNDNNPYGKQV